MTDLVIIILAVSLILYALLGGADFGAGIIEIFAPPKEEPMISRAMAPVWEANHVWLILAVVILFTGFPEVYSSLSLVLHIPLMVVLTGIILRGSAFTFRHYDIREKSPYRYYSFFFKASSLVTPLFLGVTLGAMILGKISFNEKEGFVKMFLFPWANIFCLLMGVFCSCLFAYIAAVFLTGESKTSTERTHFFSLAKRSMTLTLICGFLVFVDAEREGLHLLRDFLSSPVSVGSLFITLLLVPVIIYYLRLNKRFLVRTAIGLQVTTLITGWFAIQYPVIINVSNGRSLTFFNTSAPESTMRQLVYALIAGLLLIIPGFICLFLVFKTKRKTSRVDS